jgi:hypothetical protein
MIELRAPGCLRHRDALIDFIDRREVGPETAPALVHLERCRACEWELESTALAITALRRLVAEAEPLEPSPDAWSRLRARVDRPRAALWRWRTTLAGIAVSAGLVATLVAPRAIWQPRLAVSQDGYRVSSSQDASVLIERMRALQRPPLPQDQITILAPPNLAPSDTSWAGPDGLGYKVTAPTEPRRAERID